LVLPAATLIGMIMFGNLLKECSVPDRLSETVINALMNIVTIFLSTKTLKIFALGVIAFGIGAEVSAVPMSARVAHKIAQEENPQNFLLIYGMGSNVAGVIGPAVAAALFIYHI
jgi:oxaloacetate decarboxylase beta subunit